MVYMILLEKEEKKCKDIRDKSFKLSHQHM